MCILCLFFIFILIHGAMVMGIYWGKLTPVTVMFRVTKIRENTTQRIHTCTPRITLFLTHRHTQLHGHKSTILTIIQLLPGTTIIGHIALLVNYFLSPGSLYSFPAGIWDHFGLTLIKPCSTFSRKCVK